MTNPSAVVDSRNLLGEGPLWCPREQALWWIDGAKPSLWRWAYPSGQAESWPLPKPPAALALLEDGALLIAFRRQFALLAEPGGELQWIDMPGLALGDERFNDGKVDRRGRFWIGTMDRALNRPSGRLYCFDRPQHLQAVDSGFTASNGIGWSPDDRVMYFTETYSNCIYRYDFDLETARLSNRRVFVQLADGHPDGLTVDAAGGVWSVLFERGCVNRYLPDGTLDRSIELPVSRPTSCIFGGPEMRTLFFTSARFSLDENQLVAEPMAGATFALEVPESGIAEPRCSLFAGAALALRTPDIQSEEFSR